MVAFTEKAAERVKKLMADRPTTGPATGVRVGVKGGGCSGLSYVFEITDAPRPRDLAFESQGVKLYCDPKSHLYLDGTVVDFVSTLMETGFKFVNPKVQHSCGCGSSFSV